MTDDQLPLDFTRPRARSTDPHTSHAAAASVRNLRESQHAVLHTLQRLGRATDEQIAAAYPDWLQRQSPSGLRSRRAELVEAGYVEDSGERGRTASGRQTIIWQPADLRPET